MLLLGGIWGGLGADLKIQVELTPDEIQEIAQEAAKLVPASPARPGETFNVRDYGAVGDWFTDDSPAFQLTIEAAWQSVMKQFHRVRPEVGSDREASAHVGAVVLLPPGSYRHSKSLIIPPGVSLIGTYQKSVLFHQETPRGSPSTNSFRVNDETSPGTHGKTAQIVHLGEVKRDGHVLDSNDDSIIGIHTESRGNNISILALGRHENFRVRDCVLKGFPAGDWAQTSIGIAVNRVSQEIKADWLGEAIQSNSGWLTDGEISGCFFELFEVGVYGPLGQSTFVTDNIFESCRVGIRTFSAFGITVQGNRFHAFDSFVRNPDRPKSWADTALVLQGTEMAVQDNHIVGYAKAMIISGRDVVVQGNLAKYRTWEHSEAGYFVEIASASKAFKGRQYNDGGIQAGATIGGGWEGYWNYIISDNTIFWPVRDKYYLSETSLDAVVVPPGFQVTQTNNNTSKQ